MGANHHRHGALLWLYIGNHNTSHLFLWTGNGSSLVWPWKGNSGYIEHLIVSAQQIASQQTLV